tara:strand:- start:2580 stop:2873 length:294 start_codon:yes stop_codon:yes gene_type:complete
MYQTNSFLPRNFYKGNVMAIDEQKIDKTQIITVNMGDEIKPRRPDSKVGKIFAQYKEGITVEQWLAKVKPLGGGLSHLRKDVKYGRISLINPERYMK